MSMNYVYQNTAYVWYTFYYNDTVFHVVNLYVNSRHEYQIIVSDVKILTYFAYNSILLKSN